MNDSTKTAEHIYNLVCKHFPNDENFQAFYKEFYKYYTKYECDIHSCDGHSPDGVCPLCKYDQEARVKTSD